MKNTIMKLTLCVLMLLGLLSINDRYVSAELTTAAEKTAAIQKAYESIKDIKGSFVQKSTIKDLKKTETYQGQFFIKAKQMRWEYKGDKHQIVYITGKDIIIYQPQQKQAFKAAFSQAAYGQAPIALLSGFGNIEREFSASMRGEKLVLTPKAPMGNISSVEVKTADEGFPIKALSVIDKLGNRIDIEFSNVKTNTNIKNSIFTFKAPEGVTVLEQ
jgi:outer membrane lipoprotein carrier protein